MRNHLFGLFLCLLGTACVASRDHCEGSLQPINAAPAPSEVEKRASIAPDGSMP